MMRKFDAHVCLVSDQATPNYVPVLDKNFRPKEVVLLVTKQMEVKAQYLADIMQSRCGVKVAQISVPNAYDKRQISNQVFDLLCQFDKEKVALNVTGGNKLMALAAYATFKENGYPVFYFTVDSNEVLILDDDSTDSQFTLQPPKIDIKDYLLLHGHQLHKAITRSIHQKWLPYAQELVKKNQTLADEVGCLNWAISEAIQNNKHAVCCAIPQWHHPQSGNNLLALLQKYELAEVEPAHHQLCFSSEEAREYVNGGWFEEYVFDVVKSLNGIQDIAINVEIKNADPHITQPNELDVVAMIHNVLCVIECKTVNFTNRRAQSADKAKDYLYKLESLRQLGGLRTRPIFASYRAVNSTTRDRAKGTNIQLIEQKDLPGMKTLLAKWTGD